MATRRNKGRIEAGLDDVPDQVDLVAVGLGATGAGVALDAATRGLSVLAVDAHDVAFGTSRWSSKLVHGGLRYLTSLQVDVAWESAVERGILLTRTAPHLVRALPAVVPKREGQSRLWRLVGRAGLVAGDVLRRSAGTPSSILPPPRRISVAEACRLVPSLEPAGLKYALLTWDGQVEDDARLVITLARTAAHHGAVVRTRSRVLSATGTEVRLRDVLSGAERTVTARTVVNATGVWAASLADEIRLRPSRGTHVVLRGSSIPGLKSALFTRVPGTRNRYVMALPQSSGLIYVGLTDEPVHGPIPDVPEATEGEIGFLLDVLNSNLATPVRRDEVVGAFAGLRPLLDTADGHTADLSRRHAVRIGRDGVVTITGGKLTTYRRMAEDAVDAALEHARLDAGCCRTADLPLLGAAPAVELAARPEPADVVRRYGTEAGTVIESAAAVTGLGTDELLEPVAPGVPATLAELIFGVTHEGAASVEDLLDRRTRIGLVPSDRAQAVPAAERALRLVSQGRRPPGR